MASAVVKFAAKKYLGDAMNKHKRKAPCGDDDPFFQYIDLPNGKKRKVKKQIPDYIPEHDAKILAKVKSRAYHLDMSLFDFAGIRFGWSSVIGIIPEIGDLIDAAMALKLRKKCCEVDATLPSSVRNRMLMNIIIDGLIGIIPFIGDLFDAAFKANTKNATLLEKHLIDYYKPTGMTLDQAKQGRLEEFPNDDPPPYQDSQSTKKKKSTQRA